MAGKPLSRDELRSRQLPKMELSSGAADSMTAPLDPTSASLSTVERAAARFAIEGNAIITGGTGHLGLSAARALLEHGLTGLALFDVNPAQAAADITRLQADFPVAKIVAKRVDVRDAAAVGAAVEESARELGGVHILCCFAGVVQCTHALDMTPEEWSRTLDINTTGSWFCAQAVARQLIAQGTPGSILLTASISGHRVNFPQPQVAYNVSKAAVLALRASLAAEWARYGIRVNSVSPGYMDTILNEGDGLEEARQEWYRRNPWGRMGKPDELQGVVVAACSARAGAYITGADFVVDGGGLVF